MDTTAYAAGAVDNRTSVTQNRLDAINERIEAINGSLGNLQGVIACSLVEEEDKPVAQPGPREVACELGTKLSDINDRLIAMHNNIDSLVTRCEL